MVLIKLNFLWIRGNVSKNVLSFSKQSISLSQPSLLAGDKNIFPSTVEVNFITTNCYGPNIILTKFTPNSCLRIPFICGTDSTTSLICWRGNTWQSALVQTNGMRRMSTQNLFCEWAVDARDVQMQILITHYRNWFSLITG